MVERPLQLAMISIHGDPVAELGSDGAGGQNVYVRESALALGKLGHSVDVFTRRDRPDSPDIEHFSSRCRAIRISAGKAKYINRDSLHNHMRQFANSMQEFIEQHALYYDALHTHYWHSGWTGVRISERFSIPHFHTSHSLGKVKHSNVSVLPMSAHLRLAVELEILQQCDLAIATCPQEEEIILRQYTSVSRVSVLPCGVNLELFRPIKRQKARKILGLQPDGFIVLFVGRFDERKGLRTLVRAISLLASSPGSEPLCRLIIIGGTKPGSADEIEYQRVVSYITRLKLTDHVQFAGQVPHRTLGLYYAAADVVAIPSYYEPFGLVALESMACGVPVVASKVGGLQHTVINGRTGLLVPPRKPHALAGAIRKLLNNEGLRKSLGAQALERAKQNFSWSEIARGLNSFYTSIPADDFSESAVPASAEASA